MTTVDPWRRWTARELLEYKRLYSNVPSVVSVRPDDTVRKAASLLVVYGLSRLPVLDANRCVGSVSAAAMLRGRGGLNETLHRRVTEILEKPLETVPESADYDAIADRLSADSDAVLVEGPDGIAGVLTASDAISPLLTGGGDEYVI